MAKKYYAVRRGRRTGLFTDWADCQAQIDGFPGAVFKGFQREDEARAWLSGDTASPPAAKRVSSSSRPTSPRGWKRRTAAITASHRGFADHPAASRGLENSADEATAADFIVYTDGSCLRNPDGPGGYAAVIIGRGGQVTELSGGAPSTTNNRMEMTAGIEALKRLPDGAVVEFYTDSQYLQNAFTKHWLAAWKRRGWMTVTGTPVKNQALWQALEAEMGRLSVRFHWVKGHAGNAYNERCDELARAEAARQA